MIDNSQQVLSALEQAIERGLEAIGQTAVSYATLLCKVDTGRLRASITFATESHQSSPGELEDGSSPQAEDYALHGTPEKNTVVVGTNVFYGPYVEFKTKPFLRPAVENHEPEYKQFLIDALKGGTP